ncbi:glycosyltransferase [bacterium]|nr:glycosyltransferase [bacterium]
MNPLISVIVPIFNVEKYLNRCVDSIINQTYENLEIILVDDGSTDGCPGICDDYAKKDSRIKVIHKENGGLSDARNAGMKTACGEYISFVDSDDWIDLQTYSLVLQKMLDTQSQIGAFNIISVSDGDFSPDLSDKFEVFDSQTAIENTIDDIKVKTVAWNKLYHRSVLKDLSFKVGRLNEDEFFTFYALDKADRIVYLYRQCYYYYQRPYSIMGSYSIKRLDMLDGVRERMSFTKEHYPEIYPKAKLSFCGCCVYQYQMLLRNKKVDKYKEGKQKIKKLRSTVKLTSAEVKSCRFIERISLKMSNSSIGLSLICMIRNLLGYGI